MIKVKDNMFQETSRFGSDFDFWTLTGTPLFAFFTDCGTFGTHIEQ